MLFTGPVLLEVCSASKKEKSYGSEAAAADIEPATECI
jgi:hypothetical protein